MANVVTPLPLRSAPTPATPATPSPALAAAEIAALALSLAHLGTGPQAATARDGLRRLFELPADADADLDVDDAIVATLATLTEPLDEESAARARVVAAAITDGLVVRLSYRDAHGAMTVRDVEPVTCLVHRDNWYLVAWCRLRQDIRAFRFDRLLEIEPTGIPAPAHPAERFLPFQRRAR